MAKVGYKRLQGVTKGLKGLQGLQGVTSGKYWGFRLIGVTGGYRGLQGVTRG